MDSVLLQYNFEGRKSQKCSIDFKILTSVIKERQMFEWQWKKFVCLSLADNIQKKIVYNQQFSISYSLAGG